MKKTINGKVSGIVEKAETEQNRGGHRKKNKNNLVIFKSAEEDE
jgi:hypothetical protein